MVELHLIRQYSGEVERRAENEAWVELARRLCGKCFDVAVTCHRASPRSPHLTTAQVFAAAEQGGGRVTDPAVLVVRMHVDNPGRALLHRTSGRKAVIVGWGSKNSWIGEAEQWPLVIRGLFAVGLGMPACARSDCFFSEPGWGLPPFSSVSTQVCDTCRQTITSSDVWDHVAVAQDWLGRNVAPGAHVHELSRVSRRRFWRLSAARPPDDLRVDTDVLRSYVEEPVDPGSPAYLPEELWCTGQALVQETFGSWRSLPGDVLDALKQKTSCVRDLDALSYLTAKRHREHADHAVNVGLLCELLLDARLPTGVSMAQAALRALGLDHPEGYQDLRATMWALSMWHDAGYSLNRYLETIARTQKPAIYAHKRLVDLGASLFQQCPVSWTRIHDIASSADILESALAETSTLLSACFKDTPARDRSDRLLRYLLDPGAKGNSWAVLNHGIWSLWLLQHSLEEKIGKLHGGRDSDVLWVLACDAILFHDMSPKLFAADASSVRFDENPLLVLLKLCDVAQDWNRHVFGKTGMAKELDAVYLGGVEWTLDKPALVKGDIKLLLEYTKGEEIIDAEWQYAMAVKGLADRVSAIRFPSGADWEGGPRQVLFQIVSPSYSPELVDQMRKAAS